MINSDNYRKSWDELQNCLDFLNTIEKYDSQSILNTLVNHFKEKKLYPYNGFLSINADIKDENKKCSICNLST